MHAILTFTREFMQKCVQTMIMNFLFVVVVYFMLSKRALEVITHHENIHS